MTELEFIQKSSMLNFMSFHWAQFEDIHIFQTCIPSLAVVEGMKFILVIFQKLWTTNHPSSSAFSDCCCIQAYPPLSLHHRRTYIFIYRFFKFIFMKMWLLFLMACCLGNCLNMMKNEMDEESEMIIIIIIMIKKRRKDKKWKWKLCLPWYWENRKLC